jgi:hypothetical protein
VKVRNLQVTKLVLFFETPCSLAECKWKTILILSSDGRRPQILNGRRHHILKWKTTSHFKMEDLHFSHMKSNVNSLYKEDEMN